MKIELKVDQPSLDAAKVMMAKLKGIHERVTSRAINRSLVTVRAAAVDLIAMDLNLTKTKIRDSFEMYSATVANPSGGVSSKSKPIPLIDFNGTRPLARGGVSVQVKRTGTREHLRHAFIATMKSGHEGVFERDSWFGRTWVKGRQYARLPREYRLPIDEMFGPRITDEYAKGPILNMALATAGDVYAKNFEHELDYYLGLL